MPTDPLLTPASATQDTTQNQHLLTIQDALDKMIDNMASSPSVLSQMAHGWGQIPVWLKIVGALLVFGAMLAIGVCMQIHVLSIITCICVVLYTLISLSLDDHHQAAQKSNESIKEGVDALTNMLGAVFLELDELAKKLTVSVDTLSEENQRFGANNAILSEQLATLESELNQLKATSAELKLTHDQLKETNMGLEKEVSSLQQEVNQLNTTTKKLRVLTESFAALLARGEEAERAFKDKFDENIKAMQAGHQSFADAIESIFSVNESLQKLKADLEAGALRNEVLLEKYHNLLTVHEARATFGLYAKEPVVISPQPVLTGLEIRAY